MYILKDFDYLKAKSAQEAVEFLQIFPRGSVLAGGTDLICNIKDGVVNPDVLIDLKGIKSLSKIEFLKNKLRIGSLVTFTDLINSKIISDKFPILVEMAKTVASPGIRNRATIVGNICSAVPSMDSAPVLLVYDAVINILGIEGERSIPIKKFFKRPRKTVLKRTELVTSIEITFPKEKHGGCFVKLGRYAGEDLAQVNVAVLAFSNKQYHISFGAVTPIPIRAKQAERILYGQEPIDGLMEKVKQVVVQEISPISDIRATKEYRTHMSKIMLERAVDTATKRINEPNLSYGKLLI